jgi:hypothetical protein
MPQKPKINNKERFCPWCERKYDDAPSEHTGPLCPDCREELMEQSKDFLVDMLGHVAGVNVIAMAALAANSPETLGCTWLVECARTGRI